MQKCIQIKRTTLSEENLVVFAVFAKIKFPQNLKTSTREIKENYF